MGPLPIPAPDTLKGVDDLLRSGLEAYRESWFNWLLISTALVVVGLLFEAPEIWHETVEAISEVFHLCKPPRRISAWVKLCGTLGWVLIVVGVAGEFVAEAFVSKADGFVQKFDEILLADTTKEAGDAKASAEGAALAADRAKASAGAAVVAAGKAQEKVGGVAKRAEEVDNSLAMTQFLISARHVENIKTLTEQLRQFKGQTVVLASYNADSEEYGLCFILKSITHDAGMNPIDQCGMWNSNGPPATGVSVRGPDDNGVLSMAEMISRTGRLAVQSGPYGNAPKPATFVILVGPKSPFDIGQARGVKAPTKKHTKKPSAKP